MHSRWPLLLLFVGCRVADAPENLEQLMAYGLVAFDDPLSHPAIVEALIPELEAHRADLEQGMRANRLTGADLREAGQPVRGPVDIMGAVGLVHYTHETSDVLRVITHLHKDRVFEGTVEYAVEDRGRLHCFRDGDCDTYFHEVTETSKVPILGEAVQRSRQEFAWTETPEGDAVLLGRTLAPEPVDFNTNLMAIHQQYGFLAIFETDSGSERVEAFWVDATFIGLDVPDRTAVNSAVNAMHGYAAEVDEWLER